MKTRTQTLAFVIAVAAIVVKVAGALRAQQSPAVALAASVRRPKARWKSVLVSARREGSPMSVTVISDAAGRYAFPAGRLVPGVYRLSIRAAGYDLADPTRTVVVGRTAKDDLQLVPTADLEDQISGESGSPARPGHRSRRPHSSIAPAATRSNGSSTRTIRKRSSARSSCRAWRTTDSNRSGCDRKPLNRSARVTSTRRCCRRTWRRSIRVGARARGSPSRSRV